MNKSLEALLKSVKFFDERVHGFYERQASRLDKKSPNGRYFVATAFDAASTYFLFSLPSGVFQVAYQLVGFNLFMDVHCFLLKRPSVEGGAKSGVEQRVDKLLGAFRWVRPFVFVPGLAVAGFGAYGAGSEFFNEGSISVDSFTRLKEGFGLILLASSMYVRDRNPKLLDKTPVWKMIYNALSVKVKTLGGTQQPWPQPAPFAIPWQNTYTL